MGIWGAGSEFGVNTEAQHGWKCTYGHMPVLAQLWWSLVGGSTAQCAHGLVTFLTALTKYVPKQLKGERAYSEEGKYRVHLVREGTMAVAHGNWSCHAHSQKQRDLNAWRSGHFLLLTK